MDYLPEIEQMALLGCRNRLGINNGDNSYNARLEDSISIERSGCDNTQEKKD